MTLFLYIILFTIGCLIGSFCTLAVYRIPLKKDITHEHSFCPNCNHKLVFLDLIPIFSYVFLRGKCRYCGKKIRIRYLVLEIFAGTITVLMGLSLKIQFTTLSIDGLMNLLFGILYIIGITIIAGIDKENKRLEKSVLTYNIGLVATYILYLFIVGQANINRYAIYLFFVALLICLAIYDRKNKRKLAIGYYICIINYITLIISNFVYYYL